MKVHIAINNARALCGVSPNRGHDIRTMSTFFQSESDDQCCRCLELLERRGYSIKRLRESSVPMPRASVVADRMAAHHA